MRRLAYLAVVLWSFIALPIFLFVMGAGLQRVLDEGGVIAFVFCCLAMFSVVLGFAAMVDRGRKQVPPPWRDR